MLDSTRVVSDANKGRERAAWEVVFNPRPETHCSNSSAHTCVQHAMHALLGLLRAHVGAKATLPAGFVPTHARSQWQWPWQAAGRAGGMQGAVQ